MKHISELLIDVAKFLANPRLETAAWEARHAVEAAQECSHAWGVCECPVDVQFKAEPGYDTDECDCWLQANEAGECDDCLHSGKWFSSATDEEVPASIALGEPCDPFCWCLDCQADWDS